jgi:hypothetical protein
MNGERHDSAARTYAVMCSTLYLTSRNEYYEDPTEKLDLRYRCENAVRSRASGLQNANCFIRLDRCHHVAHSLKPKKRSSSSAISLSS